MKTMKNLNQALLAGVVFAALSACSQSNAPATAANPYANRNLNQNPNIKAASQTGDPTFTDKAPITRPDCTLLDLSGAWTGSPIDLSTTASTATLQYTMASNDPGVSTTITKTHDGISYKGIDIATSVDPAQQRKATTRYKMRLDGSRCILSQLITHRFYTDKRRIYNGTRQSLPADLPFPKGLRYFLVTNAIIDGYELSEFDLVPCSDATCAKVKLNTGIALRKGSLLD